MASAQHCWGGGPRPTLLGWRPRPTLLEMGSSADLARDVTIGVTSLADPASVVITGVAFREKSDVPSGWVCDCDDYLMNIMTIDRTILTMMIRVILIVTLMCIALLSWMILSGIMICMGRTSVLCIIRWCRCGALLNWWWRSGRVWGWCTLLWASSDKPVNSVIYTSGPDGLGGPCDEAGDVWLDQSLVRYS